MKLPTKIILTANTPTVGWCVKRIFPVKANQESGNSNYRIIPVVIELRPQQT